METLDTETPIGNMDIFTAKEYRAEATKRIAYLRSKDTIKLETVMSAEKKNALILSINWLHTHGFIKKKTRYAFLKFAVEKMMENILAQHEKEQAQLQQQAIRNSQSQPQPATNYRQPGMQPK